MRSITRVAAALALLLVAEGCSILAPVPDRSRFFTLTAMPEPPPTTTSRPGGDRIYGLGPITIPAYLDRREIAVRLSPTEISYLQDDFWAEALGTNVASVLQQNLSTLLRPARVVAYPYPATLPVDYRVEIRLLRFEHDQDGRAALVATWSVHDVRGRRLVLAEESTHDVTAASPDPTSATAALSQALGALTTEIATALRSLPVQAQHAR